MEDHSIRPLVEQASGFFIAVLTILLPLLVLL